MTEVTNENANEVQDTSDVQDELTNLKATAKTMGIKHHPAIGLDTLKQKIADHKAGIVPEVAPVAAVAPAKAVVREYVETPEAMRVRLRLESMKLVRVVVTCLDPSKNELQSDMFSVSNSVIGTVKRVIPFNNDEGWHIEKILLTLLQEKKCQIFRTVKDAKGRKVRKGSLINAYSVVILPPLTAPELQSLKERQTATKSIED